MRIKNYILLVIILFAAVCVVTDGHATERKVSEYEVKAAYIYKFLQFIDWPEKDKKNTTKEDCITIGVFNEKMHEATSKVIQGKTIKKNGGQPKSIAIKHITIKDTAEIEQLKLCQVLFLNSDDKGHVEEILNCLKGRSVLTIGEMEGFLERGGIINLLTEDNKVRFEINKAAAESAGIIIRSKLLRLAKRVVSKKDNNNN
ncbi:MAG: YfiR family protein [Planctomycetota bacterium]|jgi:hypothetical protein